MKCVIWLTWLQIVFVFHLMGDSHAELITEWVWRKGCRSQEPNGIISNTTATGPGQCFQSCGNGTQHIAIQADQCSCIENIPLVLVLDELECMGCGGEPGLKCGNKERNFWSYYQRATEPLLETQNFDPSSPICVPVLYQQGEFTLTWKPCTAEFRVLCYSVVMRECRTSFVDMATWYDAGDICADESSTLIDSMELLNKCRTHISDLTNGVYWIGLGRISFNIVSTTISPSSPSQTVVPSTSPSPSSSSTSSSPTSSSSSPSSSQSSSSSSSSSSPSSSSSSPPPSSPSPSSSSPPPSSSPSSPSFSSPPLSVVPSTSSSSSPSPLSSLLSSSLLPEVSLASSPPSSSSTKATLLESSQISSSSLISVFSHTPSSVSSPSIAAAATTTPTSAPPSISSSTQSAISISPLSTILSTPISPSSAWSSPQSSTSTPSLSSLSSSPSISLSTLSLMEKMTKDATEQNEPASKQTTELPRTTQTEPEEEPDSLPIVNTDFPVMTTYYAAFGASILVLLVIIVMFLALINRSIRKLSRDHLKISMGRDGKPSCVERKMRTDSKLTDDSASDNGHSSNVRGNRNKRTTCYSDGVRVTNGVNNYGYAWDDRYDDYGYHKDDNIDGNVINQDGWPNNFRNAVRFSGNNAPSPLHNGYSASGRLPREFF